MDLLRVDPNTYLPDTLVEGYTSLIWTERMLEAGGFELSTPEIEKTASLLPEGSFVTLRDTKEVMVVESHTMTRSPEGTAELKLFGSTYDTLLRGRVMVANEHGKDWPVLWPYKGSEFISMLAWTHLVNRSGEDPSRADTMMDVYGWIPQVVVTDSSTIAGVTEDWTLAGGEVYQRLRDFLSLSDLGVRTIRPSKTTGNVMSFDTSRTASRGTPIKTPTSNIAELRLDVYNGLDRTKNQSSRPAVIFHYEAGHIDQPQYLISLKEYRNVAVISTSIGSFSIVPHTTPPEDGTAAGLDRRVLFVDGGSKADEESETDFTNAAIQKGYIELAKHNRVVMFDGAISPLAPYAYNVDYFLGDRVTLMGEFGFEETMFISEYIRTEDINGERGYPGLARRLEYDSARKRTAERFLPQ